ncbi:sigma-54 dependent transcriptional regulator [Candidatus Aminicenantes bacterium AC-708-M15]|jgi:transcriptional regulator with GAF, ATPase, and Fis domain|nr:sigma-54 dependent transcriptional regulator [SCandidatus Aminicenantes bacterium Aminicenantia_JdfR_composite]MCP2597534.1 sigma-54 dependent transcriptional regulator [Candidatus Aminicenantes bacterium AC-335-G13]MCP2598743.1 sigma-54 dependent transcriptional regulator [Candidatus Aminicenantes bacterium AC-335-L06]MCP2604395.1 sigma-54 dependent transcriptional regulator [Candidatus Aminicenantes bacterium AC-708-M15]MCP2618968.1 sigma-54 dependent transcriptional regulator [Candidatus 
MSGLNELIGKSKIIEEIKKFIKKASYSPHCALISGETGVGKDLIAKLIHKLSKRAGEFVTVDSSSIPENLIESELFGYRKGSFTDAKEDKAGLIECADRGTLFFDEIADLPLHLQPKLLRVIEEKEIRRLGDTCSRKIDVRYIFATNKDLKKEVKERRFRKDLFFRIKVLSLHVPPLRERREDIPELIEYFLERENRENNTIKRVSKEALSKLLKYHFPGNIRELENIIRRAHIICEGEVIRVKDIELEEELEESVFKKKTEDNISERLFKEMIERGKSYRKVVHEPFMARELNRREVKGIIELGLKETNGSYKKLLEIFNIREEEYKRFLNILRIHKLQ